MIEANSGALTILRRNQVEARVGLGRSTIYAGIKAGTFPKPVPLGPGAVGWLEHEIAAWLAERVAARQSISGNEGGAA